MTHVIDLSGNVPSYGQESCCWCGAASAQMAMNGYPNPPDRVLIDQGPPNSPNCWDTIQANNNSTEPVVWCTDPLGLRNCLRSLNPPPGGTWNIYSDTRDSVMFNILYWINRNDYPVATLINRGGHWVVIVGYESDVEPISGSSPTLQEITYNDPEPHNVGSVITKTGAQWYGNEWNGDIMYAGTWLNTYVAVIEPPVEGKAKVKEIERVGKEIIPPEEAVKYSLRWIEELKLAKKPSYHVLERKEISNLDPILVREEIRVGMAEDEKVPYYYIVPYGIKNEVGICNVRLARIAIIVNAFTGEFEEIGAFGKAVRFLTEKEAINITTKAMNLSDDETDALKKDNLITATMMYQPSEITHIRIYPFWKVQIKEKTLFVDQLGKLYGRIEPSNPGD